MKPIAFTKMVGAGNSFVITDAQKRINYRRLALKACCQSKGIGADGLLVLDHSQIADYKMRIMNADGSEAEMCGNGARCLASYIFKQKSSKKVAISIETLAGIILARQVKKQISVRLSNPENYIKNIMISINSKPMQLSYINTGVPHTICFVSSLENIDVNTIGKKIRFDKKFSPKGTNVNFVEHKKKNLIHVRTYERGVEAETHACGTGSVASAIVAFLRLNPQIRSKKKVFMRVKTKSKEILTIQFNLSHGAISDVWLTGSAQIVAEGKFYF